MLQFSQTARELKRSRWSVGEIINVLRWRYRIVVFAILACVGIALVYLAITPDKYIATAVLLTETKQMPDESEPSADSTIDSTVVESQMEAVRSASLALRVIDKLDLASDPEFVPRTTPGLLSRLMAMVRPSDGKQHKTDPREVALDGLLKQVKIDRVGRSYVAEISATSLDRDKAARIANAVADGYIEEQLSSREESQQRANSWMENRLNDLRDQATRAESAARAAMITGANGNQQAMPASPSNSGSAPTGDIKARDLAAKARIARASYEAYLNRYTQALQLQKVAIPTTTARVLTRAIAPNGPGSPRKPLVLALSFIAGGTLGLLGAFGAEMLRAPVRSRSQLSAALGIRTFEPLPLSKVRTRLFGRDKGLPIVLIGNPGVGAATAENELRKIKIALNQFDLQKITRIIGISSPQSHDGKTTIAYNLALLTAQAGSRTLLIDANMHNPTLSHAFCEPGVELLTTFLTGADASIMVVRLSENLSFIGQHALTTRDHPADVFSSDAMQRALHRAQQSFDYIIVDLPAMLHHVEARAIAPLLDRVLLVTQWGTPLADLERCLENADTLSSRALGIVINKSPDVRSKGVVQRLTVSEKLSEQIERSGV